MTMNELIKEAKKTLKVSGLVATKYKDKSRKMFLFVNEMLSSRDDIF